MANKKSSAWQYGQSPAPKGWHEAAEALKSTSAPTKKPSSGPNLMDRLSAIEDLLKKGK